MPSRFTPVPGTPERPLPTEDREAAAHESFADVVDEAVDEFRFHTDEMAEGITTVDEWRDAFGGTLVTYHAAAHMTGRRVSDVVVDDERDDMSDAGLTEVAGVVAVQLAFLDIFTADLLALPDGEMPARQKARADMYGIATGQSWHGGYTGDFILPAYPRDGTTGCLVNCCCHWRAGEHDITTGNASFYWNLAPCQHCRQCPRRERVWYPYRFRNWVGDPVVDRSLFLSRELPVRPEPTSRRKARSLDELTPREHEVSKMLHLSNAQIGVRLHITTNTAREHVRRILGKLDCRSRAAAALVVTAAGK